MKMRAKLKVSSVEIFEHSERVKMSAVGKKDGYSDGGLDENNTFAEFTPLAELDMQITNPELKGKFKPGQEFYADFTAA